MGLLNVNIKNYYILVGSQMGKNNAETYELIDVFEKLMEIDNPPGIKNDISFDTDYAHFLNDLDFTKVKSEEILNYIEPLLKKVVMLVSPEEWNLKWEENDRAWQLAQLYKSSVIGVPNVNFNADPQTYAGEPNYLKEYVTLYQKRNEGSHGNNATALFFPLATVSLHVCEKYADEITDIYTRQKILKNINIKAYCQGIIDDYEKENTDGFYEVVKWKSDSFRDVTTENVEEKIHDKVAKLIGGPGVGKSAALQYCRYRACQRIVANQENKIPVLVELYKTDKKSIDELIAEEINISAEELDDVLKKNMIMLYLDGYNEIVDDEIKQTVSDKIDKMIEKHSGLSLLITDRDKISHPQVADKALTFNLCKLDEKQSARLMRKTIYKECKDAELASELSKLIVTEDDNYTEEVKAVAESVKKQWTPYHAIVIAKYTLFKGEVIKKENFWKQYLDELFHREGNEKKDIRTNTLADMLTYIAQHDNGQVIARSELLGIISEFDKEMGKERIESYIQLAKDMRLYIKDDDGCKFFNDEIRDCFYNEEISYGSVLGEVDNDDDDYLY